MVRVWTVLREELMEVALSCDLRMILPSYARGTPSKSSAIVGSLVIKPLIDEEGRLAPIAKVRT